jgi:cytochrome c
MDRFIAVIGFLAVCVGLGVAYAQSDATETGEKVFVLRCKVCHTVVEGETNRVGPNLSGVWGRPAGARDDFRYSSAHRKSDAVWDEVTLDLYLEDVAQVVPNPVKRFSGIKDPADRASIIAYLKTLR